MNLRFFNLYFVNKVIAIILNLIPYRLNLLKDEIESNLYLFDLPIRI